MRTVRGWVGRLAVPAVLGLLVACLFIVADDREPLPRGLVLAPTPATMEGSPRAQGFPSVSTRAANSIDHPDTDLFIWSEADLSQWNPVDVWFTRSHRPLLSLQRLWHITQNVKYLPHTDQDLGMVHIFSIWLPNLQCLLMVTPLGVAVAANCMNLKVANPRAISPDWVAGFRQAARGSLAVSKPLLYNFRTGKTIFAPWPLPNPIGVPGQVSGILLHHDLDFNPVTSSFMALAHALVRRDNATGPNPMGSEAARLPHSRRRPGKDADVDREGRVVAEDMLLEIGLDGGVIWQWHSLLDIPFNRSCFGFYPDQLQDLKQRFPGTLAVDWTHLNSVYYDGDTGAVFVNSRHLDTFYKVDRGSGRVTWAVGRMGTMTQRNVAGQAAPSLFWHAHAVTKVAPDEFLLFDNNNHNLSQAAGCPRPGDGLGRCATATPAGSSLVRLRVQPSNGTAQETFRWISAPEYYTPYHGDADVLPDGHLLGTFPGRDCLVEVEPRSGSVVWELCARGARNGSHGQDGSLFALESTRVLRWPLVLPAPVRAGTDVLQWNNFTRLVRVIHRSGEPELQLDLWNSFPQRFTANGSLSILNRSGAVLWEAPVRLRPDWVPTRVAVPFSHFLGSSTHVAGPSTTVTCCGTTHALRLRLAVPRYHPASPRPHLLAGSTGVMLHCRC